MKAGGNAGDERPAAVCPARTIEQDRLSIMFVAMRGARMSEDEAALDLQALEHFVIENDDLLTLEEAIGKFRAYP